MRLPFQNGRFATSKTSMSGYGTYRAWLERCYSISEALGRLDKLANASEVELGRLRPQTLRRATTGVQNQEVFLFYPAFSPSKVQTPIIRQTQATHGWTDSPLIPLPTHPIHFD